MHINLIVAMCRNNGIGYNGKIPWHISADLKYFSKLTKGIGNNAVVMGNKTWKSLPSNEGLANRDNFVLTKTNKFDMLINDKLIKTFSSFQEFLNYINLNAIYKEIWIIGGAEIYKQFLDAKVINKCLITYIDKDFECDTFFTPLKSSVWKETERVRTYDDSYKCNVDYVIYRNTYIS
jgi:dihydrofolate reductase